jgi:CheY-like chemotaxis protein/nitrogen-specific signal transduction histidine kinase
VSFSSLFGSSATATPDELRGRLRVLEALIARAPVPIAVAHDAECRVISANAALAELLGVAPGGNISLTPPPGESPPYRIQVGGRDVPTAELPMQYAIAHRTGVSSHIEIVRADGRVCYVKNDVEPLYDAGGEVAGCVSVCVDLTEGKRVEDMLREADRRKDEFLATLSHELRNPLAPLHTALEVLRLAGYDPVRRDQAHAIMERQLQQLVRLTDDLLDVSRITRNRIELRRERIDLRSVLLGAVETNQPLVDAAGHELTCDLPGAPCWLDADFTRLSQAFANLLNNAAKYTDRGGRVSVSLTTDRGYAVVAIRDSGIGIAPSVMPRIFDIFMQVDRSLNRAQGGLGIGLTLARRLIELHDGALEASSDGQGRGSTFIARLPLVAGAPEAEPARDTAPAAAVRCRVLIAEDIPDAAEMLRVMLDLLGHDVRVALDGVQAVAVALEFAPQIALLDIGMPRKDGYEAAREIRAALGPAIVLVALTGWRQDEDQRRALEAGFDYHLTKPAAPGRLEALIALAAGRSS